MSSDINQASKRSDFMNTFKNKLRAGALGLALVSTCVVTLPAQAQDSNIAHKGKGASKQENVGVMTGLAVGAVAGGPIGAIVGAAAGAWVGDRYHKQEVARKELATDLSQSQVKQSQLSQNVVELNTSLAEVRAKSEKLDLALKNTDELQTDVSFRTNDDGIGAQSMPPLLKIGALAASMPDMKVRVSGYADPRGSEEVNDALSRRRAEAVAAVLEKAGLPKDRMIVEGHGKSESTAVDGDLDGYAFERKVTVRLEHVGSPEVARND
jgi:outer membrane protein OmpA-like peptidoglycan-associated protein